ncbi:MAG: hypothetical protein GY859_08885 [Desulfobacterales bacterium]|nr:hypothetical protein [Desulfobacterales bacterium]
MTLNFKPDGRPLLAGSIPMDDHEEAARLVLAHTPDIPIWAQLPIFKNEGMIAQFTPGLPGIVHTEDALYVDTGAETFDEELLAFYEAYMSVSEGQIDLTDAKRFALTPDVAKGFFVLMERVKALAEPPFALKGQITGPITLGTGTPDQDKRAIFYNEQLRDAAVKLLAMKAAWQVRQLSTFGRPVIIFIDEPALAGVGSSEMISISREEITACLEEVVDAVHAEGGLAGVHVCANTDWALLLESNLDIINFDAYGYFDRFILYAEQIKKFLESGRILAWGVVPTLSPLDIERETADALTARWEESARQVTALGVSRSDLVSGSLITPSCGTGSLSLELAKRAIGLTVEVSRRIRAK